MEIVILVFIFRWFSSAANAAGRPPLRWGTTGAAIYLGALILSKGALYWVFDPYYLPEARRFAFTLLDTMLSNAVGVGFANLFCQQMLLTNLTTTKNLARVLNASWLIFASFILVSLLPNMIGESGILLNVLVLAGLVVVPLLTLRVYKAESKNLTGPLWHTHIALWANLAAALTLIWYVTTLKLSHPVAFSISTAYYSSWIAIAACLNTISLGLTIRSTGRAKTARR
ncbi:MAG: hypothetical protein IIA10_02970 [Proteobacteria bacterium]|nr:hypothetical protein [Pseudomonadota bacterium]